jgi:hypothetical protein
MIRRVHGYRNRLHSQPEILPRSEICGKCRLFVTGGRGDQGANLLKDQMKRAPGGCTRGSLVLSRLIEGLGGLPERSVFRVTSAPTSGNPGS